MAETDRTATERPSQLADENALLRASLAQMRERVDELEQAADLDTLTPLPNRRGFLRELERAVGQAERHGTPAALLHIELSNLAAINGGHGQVAGDAALIHMAKLLGGLIRSTDALARIDGDAFGLILDHLDHNSAIETADRLFRCIAGSPLDLGSATVALHATIGIATILPGDTVDDVVRRAEHTLRAAREEA
ncbi:GGDEF domain-containing protein [Sphingosinicella humi]|uniref:GGDEF domain-containing protein n=1 Tax=Allosphingosinicella humi TaxID=2068657 RepID=A0A2U2J365_9SPHN|nr:GGDEF domain-containing protein [Sphingosinicella humi]PWG02752.1 GGDEF domain-containing protein [Sphingosinicella humi]